jgi:UDP-glucose 4-epimerase
LRILVTGGAGYVGGTVARILAHEGHAVVVYDNLCHAARKMVPSGVEFIEGELSDRLALEKLLTSGFDGVMHFAALIEAGESMKKPEIYFRNNSAATLTLIEAMLATNVRRLVFSSTAAVYGEHSRRRSPPSDQFLRGIEAVGGKNAHLDVSHPRFSLCQPALFQCGGRGCGNR